jgi:hypothetical protein
MTQIFLTGLFVVSLLTGLVTEGIKRLLDEYKKEYHSNVVAGIVAVVFSVLVDIGYTVVNNMAFDAVWVVYLISLIILSWLCAMLGYDKVIQTLAQIGSKL